MDGYNVLHAIARFAPRGGPVEPAREAFESWLAQAARRRGVEDAVVVWDGRRGGRAVRAPSPLTVLFTPRGKTADERILELCRGRYAGRAATTWVVSSDHGIQRPARQLGFEGIGAMTFYRRWSTGKPSASAGEAPREEERPRKPERPSADEVEELLDAFLRQDEESPGG